MKTYITNKVKPKMMINEVEFTINNSFANAFNAMTIVDKAKKAENKELESMRAIYQSINVLIGDEQMEVLNGMELTPQDFTNIATEMFMLLNDAGANKQPSTDK